MNEKRSPRCAIVSSKLLQKHGRWDAEFYLGDVSKPSNKGGDEKLAAREERLARETESLARAKADLMADKEETAARKAKWLADGDVKYLS